MKQTVDPKSFGLPARTIVEEIDRNTLAIVIHRKSRIIMADGKKIYAKAEKIKRAAPQMKVLLKTTAPVCSKTSQYLKEQGIEIISS